MNCDRFGENKYVIQIRKNVILNLMTIVDKIRLFVWRLAYKIIVIYALLHTAIALAH